MIRLRDKQEQQKFIENFLSEYSKNNSLVFRTYCRKKLKMKKGEIFPSAMYIWLQKYDTSNIYNKTTKKSTESIEINKVEIKRTNPTTTTNITISYCGEMITLPTNVDPQILAAILSSIKEGTKNDI